MIVQKITNPISKEVSNILKQKGYFSDIFFTGQVYNNKGDILPTATYLELSDKYPLVDASTVVDYFLDKYNIFLEVSPSHFSKPGNIEWFFSIIYLDRCSYTHGKNRFKSRNEAYNECIKYFLNEEENKIKKEE
jgi:hypothetical protein